jgi:hypothetical protein
MCRKKRSRGSQPGFLYTKVSFKNEKIKISSNK